jgi:hypothetical protein
VRSSILLFIFCLATCRLAAQADDSVDYTSNYDSIEHDESSLFEEIVTADQDAPSDTTFVEKREFADTKLKELYADNDLHYKEPPAVGTSLWERFLQWLNELILSFFDKTFNTGWGNTLAYLAGIIVLVIIVMMILKVDAFKILYGGGGSKLKAQILDEDIHEMDFDLLIKEAVSKQDFRRGIRLLFLYALKILSDKHFIHWELGKTNHEYVGELKEKDLKRGLNELSFYFDYAWYGNFNITAETFAKAEQVFISWKQKVKT